MTQRSRSYYKRKQRKLQLLRRNLFIFVFTVTVIIGFLFLQSSMSTQASDFSHQPSYRYFTTVEVQPGDTLWTYAERYADRDHYKDNREYIKEVMRMNGMASERIYSGCNIILPYYSTEFVTASMKSK